MIEIIGKNQNKKKKATCDNCWSILAFYPVDTLEKTVRDYDGSYFYVKYIVCPECKNEINV